MSARGKLIVKGCDVVSEDGKDLYHGNMPGSLEQFHDCTIVIPGLRL